VVDLKDWLKENEEAVVGHWLIAVQDKAIPHYEGLTVDQLREELIPLYHCLVSTTTLSGVDVSMDATAALSNWMLDQRLSRSCSLSELLEITFLLRSTIGQTLAESGDPARGMAIWQELIPFFDHTATTLAELFTQAIEDNLMERLREAEFATNRLTVATEEIRALNLELEDRIEERTRELAEERDHMEALYNIVREVSTSLDLGTVLHKTLNMVSAVVGAEYGSVMLLDPTSEALVYRAVLGHAQPLPRDGIPSPFRQGVGLVGWVMEHGQAVIVNDVTQDQRWLAMPGLEAEARSVIAAPLMVGSDVHGVLTVSDSRPGHFTDAHLRLVSAAASQIAAVVDNAQLYSYVAEQAQQLGQMLRTQQEEASKSQAILESIADGVIVNDVYGRILLLNATAERIVGVQGSTVLGQDVRTVFDAFILDGREKALAAMDSLTAGLFTSPTDSGPQIIETILKLEMGNRVVNARLAPVITRGEELLGVVTVFRDITREVEADRAKSEFVSNVSHELRTPMTSIKGYSDLLHASTVGEVNEEQKRFLSIIKSNADRLTILINDLLDISRTEAGRIELEFKPLQMGEIVLEVANSFRGQMESKGLEFLVDIPDNLGKVRGDRGRLTQILTNLIANAYHYTPAGSIRVSLSQMDDTLKVDVADTGIGIAPSDQGRIFDRFYRGDNSVVQETTGTGLGLSIAKMFVEMHGGRVWVESESGKGSTFTFVLPTIEEPVEATLTLPAVPLPAIHGQKAEAILSRKGSVLVAEDDADTACLLQEVLSQGGFEVEVALDGYEVVTTARQQRQELILLDLKLPGMDGYETITRLKQEAETREIPIVAMSAHVEERERVRALGVENFLAKPFTADELIAELDRVLASTRQRVQAHYGLSGSTGIGTE
jgi:PAS domain S-box-containing protein